MIMADFKRKFCKCISIARGKFISLMSNTQKRIRFINSDDPLVPMIGLVPIEKDVIPMVTLVNIQLIKGTLITFPIPMVRWYQWYD